MRPSVVVLGAVLVLYVGAIALFELGTFLVHGHWAGW